MNSDYDPCLKLIYNFPEGYHPVAYTMFFRLKENPNFLAASDETDLNGLFRFNELLVGTYSMLVDYMSIPMRNEK